MKTFDFLIVGSGLFGATVAHILTTHGKSCLVIEKRKHIGGNVYTENINNINVHKYGAHIFHTNNKKTWDFMNSFVEFNHYINSPIAMYKDRLYNLPFNMNTFYQLWGVKTPQEAKLKIEEQKRRSGIISPSNLEEQAIMLVGRDIYYTLIKEYTEKQWGRKATELPASIIKRLPIRLTFDNNYFNDVYQGIPKGGYTSICEKMLRHCSMLTDVDYIEDREYFNRKAMKLIYTGEIDRYFDYCYGALEYRTLKFEMKILQNTMSYQGNAVVNYIDSTIPYTRIIEHKHFEFADQPDTVITKEYPLEWNLGDEPFYPINNEKNNKRYNLYRILGNEEKNVYWGGRLAEYQYMDMNHVIEHAQQMALSILKKS